MADHSNHNQIISLIKISILNLLTNKDLHRYQVVLKANKAKALMEQKIGQTTKRYNKYNSNNSISNRSSN